VAILDDAVLDPAKFRITHVVVVRVERHGVVEGLKNSVANREAFPRSQMHPVLLPPDEHIVNDEVFEGANVNPILDFAEVRTAKALDPQVLYIEERDLTMQAENVLECAHVHSVNNDLQTFDADVLIVSSGQRTFVEQYVRERSFLHDLLQKDTMAKNQRGIAANIDRSRHLVDSRSAYDNRSALIHCSLKGLGVLHAT
jgi:hypothetical protein